MERTTPPERPLVLDVVLGVLVALALGGLAAQVRTVAAIRTIDSIGRLSLLVGSTLFAVLYWIEANVLVRVSEKDDDDRGVTAATHPLSGAFRLVVVALLALVLAFATVESMGWFLGVTAVLWLVDLVSLLLLRRPAAAAFRFLVTYSAANLMLFALLAAWNGISPWQENLRAAMAIVLLAYVLVRHVVWRPAGLARARRG